MRITINRASKQTVVEAATDGFQLSLSVDNKRWKYAAPFLEMLRDAIVNHDVVIEKEE